MHKTGMKARKPDCPKAYDVFICCPRRSCGCPKARSRHEMGPSLRCDAMRTAGSAIAKRARRAAAELDFAMQRLTFRRDRISFCRIEWSAETGREQERARGQKPACKLSCRCLARWWMGKLAKLTGAQKWCRCSYICDVDASHRRRQRLSASTLTSVRNGDGGEYAKLDRRQCGEAAIATVAASCDATHGEAKARQAPGKGRRAAAQECACAGMRGLAGLTF
jgi:hypothetical protein